jgi:hypothetical protein
MLTAVGLMLGATLVGCGNGGPATEPVSGKVIANGQPVTGGSLTFAPVSDEPAAPAQPAVAIVNPDGTFKIEEGAVAGKHRLLYSAPSVDWQAPDWDGKGAPPQPPKNPYAGLTPKVAEIEVKPGVNEVEVELVASTRR